MIHAIGTGDGGIDIDIGWRGAGRGEVGSLSGAG